MNISIVIINIKKASNIIIGDSSEKIKILKLD